MRTTIKIHDKRDSRDIFDGETGVLDVEPCPYCGRTPVYCMPYTDTGLIEIYCNNPGCGVGRAHWRLSVAVKNWNKYARAERKEQTTKRR